MEKTAIIVYLIYLTFAVQNTYSAAMIMDLAHTNTHSNMIHEGSFRMRTGRLVSYTDPLFNVPSGLSLSLMFSLQLCECWSEAAFIHTSDKRNTQQQDAHKSHGVFKASAYFPTFSHLFLSFCCVHVLSLSQRFIVCRIEGTCVISISHGNALTSPLLSLRGSLVPEPFTSY